ncbi:MAG: NADH-quinone oxidoreductase subunit N [Bdellovibrionales bacterium]|jgi:NADH-quinone oxidoreductase subunit N|nr:NADH-quinone oxidoreductase subunit N [Bdellovibrionales bacterium]MBT3526371.1 NADH-quinone oxidoreductase subunit N [Bdellovibrionales bacterium]MBT7768311.1 NADH-quinone oxidoreductase subunit N [Bdellovibrionales bacterium]
MNIVMITNLSYYLPELALIAAMVLGLFAIAFSGSRDQSDKIVFGLTMLLLMVSYILLNNMMFAVPRTIFSSALVIDRFGTLFKIIMVIGTIAAIYLGRFSQDILPEIKSEFSIIVIGVLVGGMLLASANNLLIVYLGVETLSILSYALASFNRKNNKSSEAGLKYALYGGISAGLMLFGMGHIYGVLGTIQFEGIADVLSGLTLSDISILLPSFLLFFAGLGYKIATVPFHMWAPDVYEGSPLPVTTFFAVVPKMAGMAVIMRITMVFFSAEGVLQIGWIGLLSVIAALTMTVGNVAAIGQRSVKRMLAYSSISHAGVMLTGVITLNHLGTTAILFYGVAYLFMTLTAFYVTTFVADGCENDHFERFTGLVSRHPLMAILMSIAMLSLAGIPPFSGFVAKFNILAALIEKRYFVMAVILGLNSVVSLYYYMKIVRLMVLKSPESSAPVGGFGLLNQAVIVAFTIPTLVLGLFWQEMMSVASSASLLVK